MSDRVRLKGRFIKKKVRDKQVKAVAAMREAHLSKNVPRSPPNLKFSFDGRRIVDMQYLSEHLKCMKCKKDIFLRNTVEESRMGLNCILNISCEECSTLTRVHTGKMHGTGENKNRADVNTKAVLGAVHSGIGETALNKLLACLNVPPISANLYKRYEREIGPAIEAAAKDSCREAAKEEKQLVIANVDKLCQEM
ncbi:uncharacterized protein LOC124406400 [Diprion similis]|uniref:uncharacterized protein LOC124406400 n=1 Tax=Diprion similis TaxID=362088 RepID=UPI001EF83176|nr:uncharacterized protein LOC124406400 [Diprion similis]